MKNNLSNDKYIIMRADWRWFFVAEREFKFRGLKTFQIFSGDTKSVWIYGFFLKRGTYGDPGPQAHIFVYENGYEGYRVDAKTIGQFTGYFDCNEKEIYEDDVLEHADGERGLVIYRDGAFWMESAEGTSMGMLADFMRKKAEIKGNRFEHPELLSRDQDHETHGA